MFDNASIRIHQDFRNAYRVGVTTMQLGTKLGTLGTVVAIIALVIASLALMRAGIVRVGPIGPQGPAGPAGATGTNGTNGGSGTNGGNGTDGTNGTNGQNGTSWIPLWYAFDPTFEDVGTLTYLTVSDLGCASAGSGANYCSFNVTNTCAPESSAGIHVLWACESWYYALANVSYSVNSWFCFAGSDPSLGYAIGWGQTVTVQLWFQTVVFEEYAAGSPPPNVPSLTPTIDLGFAEVSG
jgi:hypothetical protein